MSREQYSPNYFPFLRSYIDAGEVPRHRRWTCVGTRVGRIDSYRFFETLDWISILDSVIGAEQDGYDAVAIGNILDPALREARSMVDIPVLGLGETSMLTACMMGSTFSLVGVNPYFGGRFEENVAKYGLRERLASIECMGLTPHELDACFSDEEGRAKATDSFVAAARASLDKGAEVVVPAGGRLTAFLNAVGLREVDGAPLLDGTVVAGRRHGGGHPHPPPVRHLRQPSPAVRRGAGGVDPPGRRRVRGRLRPAGPAAPRRRGAPTATTPPKGTDR